MRIKKASFVTSAVNRSQYPPDNLPMVAMAGKSNVGKSSLINALSNNKKLARVSSQPGKTRLINFYLINDNFYLVDLPGYGFARASKAQQETWRKMTVEFFESPVKPACIILVVDIRHNPTADDIQMAEWIKYYNIPVVVAASKADKLGKTRLKPQCDNIRKKLGFDRPVQIIPYSAATRYGIDSLISALKAQQEFLFGNFENPEVSIHPQDL